MKNKRVLAILLAVCMVLQTAGMDTTAYASESTTDIESFVNEPDEPEEKEESSELEDTTDESDQKQEESIEDESNDETNKGQDASDSADTPSPDNGETNDPSSPENGDEVQEEGSETEDTETSEDDVSESVDTTAGEPEDEGEEEDLPDSLLWEDEENGVRITVSGELDALNGATDLSVKKLPVERAEEYKAVISADAEDDGNVKVEQSVYVYDITLLNSDGKEIEPADDVSVAFSVDEIKTALSDRPETEIEVYHKLERDLMKKKVQKSQMKKLKLRLNRLLPMKR